MQFSNFTSPVSLVLSQTGISVKDLIVVLFRVTLAGSRRLRPEQNTNRHFSGLVACTQRDFIVSLQDLAIKLHFILLWFCI